MKQTSSNRRKRFLINPTFQLKFVGAFLALGFLITLTYGSASYFFFAQIRGLGTKLGLQGNHPFFQFVDTQQNMMNIMMAVTSIISFAVILVFGLYYSNRIAGPIYRIEKYLRENSPADEKTVAFRKGDFFPELAEALNHFVKGNKEARRGKKHG